MIRGLIFLGLTLTLAPVALAQQSQSEAGCRRGDAESCFYTGAEYAQGHGVQSNMQRAVEFFLRSCDMGVPDGCNSAGVLVSRGEGNLRREQERGVQMMERACGMGHVEGCSTSLGMRISTTTEVTNYQRAIATARSGCEAGVENPCLWGLDWAYDGNDGQYPQMMNLTTAAWFAEQACDRYRDLKGCDVAARLFADPESATFDAEKGIRYSIIGCDEFRNGGHCRNVAAVYISIGEHRLGADYYARACRHGHTNSCDMSRQWQAYFTETANHEARMAQLDQQFETPLSQGRYAEAFNVAINTTRLREHAERAILATQRAGRMSDLNTNDLYAAAMWFPSGQVRQTVDAELSARGTGLEGRFGTDTNAPGAADARWRAQNGSSAPSYTSRSPSFNPPPMPSAAEISAATRDRYRYAHCTMSGSNRSAQVCQ